MTRLYEHFEQVLEYIDFRDRTGGGHLMARIRRLFNRALLDQNEDEHPARRAYGSAGAAAPCQKARAKHESTRVDGSKIQA